MGVLLSYKYGIPFQNSNQTLESRMNNNSDFRNDPKNEASKRASKQTSKERKKTRKKEAINCFARCLLKEKWIIRQSDRLNLYDSIHILISEWEDISTWKRMRKLINFGNSIKNLTVHHKSSAFAKEISNTTNPYLGDA